MIITFKKNKREQRKEDVSQVVATVERNQYLKTKTRCDREGKKKRRKERTKRRNGEEKRRKKKKENTERRVK